MIEWKKNSFRIKIALFETDVQRAFAMGQYIIVLLDSSIFGNACQTHFHAEHILQRTALIIIFFHKYKLKNL